MSTKQCEERCASSTAVHRSVERECDHGSVRCQSHKVVSMTYKKIRDALNALLCQSIVSTADCMIESECADSLHNAPLLRSSR
eukprot:326349-Pleurochrysis_carterae.AAC.1